MCQYVGCTERVRTGQFDELLNIFCTKEMKLSFTSIMCFNVQFLSKSGTNLVRCFCSLLFLFL